MCRGSWETWRFVVGNAEEVDDCAGEGRIQERWSSVMGWW